MFNRCLVLPEGSHVVDTITCSYKIIMVIKMKAVV